MPISTQQELVSEEITEIISFRPHWMVRKGSTVFLIVILVLLSLTWLIKYPDIITGSAKLVALHPPQSIKANADGRLVKLFIANEQQVVKGQILGYIESTTDYNEAIKLVDWINFAITSTSGNDFSILMKRELPGLYNLGELQSVYEKFDNEWEITKQTFVNGYFAKKKSALEKDISYLGKLKKNTSQQQELQEQDKLMLQKEFEAYEKLANEKVIAPLELNQYKSRLLAKEQNLKQGDAQLTSTEITVHSKSKELLDLEKTVVDQKRNVHSALLQLKSALDKWMLQYVLTSSENGKLVFATTLNENDLVANGQGLFYIQIQGTKYYSELFAGQKGLGKVSVGQLVRIKVASYPSNEYGYLTGMVNYISSVPGKRDSFLIRVELKNGLETNYKKLIFFRNDLQAIGEIITDDRTLFERLLGQFRSLNSN